MQHTNRKIDVLWFDSNNYLFMITFITREGWYNNLANFKNGIFKEDQIVYRHWQFIVIMGYR
ncbi:hypothetical protein HYD66_00845 [Mycoplasmopsis bovis]|nr:hypothetical protein [Mycoplasmopsis bovis]QQH55015.1 hypothetical protein HYD66_00845 [Mycoplasmopsis bovis]